MSKFTRPLIVTIAAAVTIIFNLLATALPLNGRTTAAISDKYINFFTPAGYVFAIWGVIYLGWIVYSIYHWFPKSREAAWLKPAFPLFLLSCVANVCWLVAWHYEYLGGSVVIMAVLLISLLALYLSLEIGKYPASWKTKLMVHVPISIYLGWISVATVANISAALTQVNWDGLGIASQVWVMVMMTIAMVLAMLMLANRRDVAYALVIVWALVGIAVKFSGFPVILGVAFAAVTAIFVTMLISVGKPVAK